MIKTASSRLPVKHISVSSARLTEAGKQPCRAWGALPGWALWAARPRTPEPAPAHCFPVSGAEAGSGWEQARHPATVPLVRGVRVLGRDVDLRQKEIDVHM